MLVNNDSKSNYDLILGTYNGEDNSRVTSKEVTTEEKYHQSIRKKGTLF